MLNHSVIGPYEDGSYLVVHLVPGCRVMGVDCDCRTEGQALSEADRLNAEQVRREKQIRRDRELRGLGGVYPGLGQR